MLEQVDGGRALGRRLHICPGAVVLVLGGLFNSRALLGLLIYEPRHVPLARIRLDAKPPHLLHEDTLGLVYARLMLVKVGHSTRQKLPSPSNDCCSPDA